MTDEPAGTPYRAYTKDFDRIVVARDAPALLRMEDAGADIGPPRAVATSLERVAAARRWARAEMDSLNAVGERLGAFLAGLRDPLAVFLLIDHSGSMKDEMVAVAATVRHLCALFDEHRVPLAVGGFTTIGWRGGAARRRWIASRRPARPGRLCALLHLLYRDFDSPLDDEDWRVMLDPAVLRENIDGEAIEWAVERLLSRPELNKVLVVISDGAPVDDATIAANGPDFLGRHLRAVIARTHAEGAVRLGAVGIGCRVGELYHDSAWTQDVRTLPSTLAGEIMTLATPMMDA